MTINFLFYGFTWECVWAHLQICVQDIVFTFKTKIQDRPWSLCTSQHLCRFSRDSETPPSPATAPAPAPAPSQAELSRGAASKQSRLQGPVRG